jgi:hypothetical protein
MSETKVKLSEATEAQMRQFAESYLGLSIPASARVETIRAKIQAAWGKDEIPVSADAEVSPVAQGPTITPEQASGTDEKVRIMIPITDEAGGSDHVPVGVNGVVMLIPRGEPVSIPRRYFEVLKNAVTHRFEALPDGGINPVPRKVQAYPFQLVA